jgi:hypothetical protein
MEENKDLVIKYNDILELVKDHKQHNNLAILFEISIKYLRERYKDYSTSTKISGVYIIKELYLKGLISSDNQAINIIDDFIIYYDKNYEIFIKNYDNNIFDTNMLFIKNYINKILTNDNG